MPSLRDVRQKNPHIAFTAEFKGGFLVVQGECRATGQTRRNIARRERMRDWFDNQDEAFGHMAERVSRQFAKNHERRE